MRKYFREFRKNQEEGNTFVMYVMMFGIMVLFLGLAVDTGMGFYTKNGMQSALDSAVVTGANQTNYNGNGKKIIDPNRARDTAISAFNDAKVNYPNLVNCNEKGACSKINNVQVKNDPVHGQYLTMTVTIYSKNVFLHMAGFPTQEYKLKSEARLGDLLD